jgi:hypothetical protein
LPEQDIDDGRNDPQVLRALNKDLAKRRESWLNKFKLNQQLSVQQSQSVAQFPSAGVQPPAAQVPILPPSCPRPFKVQESKTAELVCTFLLQKTIPHNFTKALGVLRRDIPKFYDSSYDSPMLEILPFMQDLPWSGESIEQKRPIGRLARRRKWEYENF